MLWASTVPASQRRKKFGAVGRTGLKTEHNPTAGTVMRAIGVSGGERRKKRRGIRTFVLIPRKLQSSVARYYSLFGQLLPGAPKPPAELPEARQGRTATKKQERCRLRRRCIGRRDVAHERRPVEEELGVATELVEATVIETVDGEHRVDLLVGAQTTEGVQQRHRNVIRAGADVVGVVERTVQNVAEDAPE